MAPSPWLSLRQAREALRADRPDEAHRLLEPLLAAGHRKAWRVAREVAAAHVRRAERLLRNDSPDAAWAELQAAEGLNTGEASAAALRQTLTRFGVAVVRAALEAGRPPAALEAAERLRERGVRHPDLPPLVEAAQDWVLAAETADRGDFLLAGVNLDRVRPRLSCPPTGLERFAADVGGRHETFRHALAELHAAVEAADWRAAIRAADAALAAAPQHREARTLRAAAWAKLNPDTRTYYRSPVEVRPPEPLTTTAPRRLVPAASAGRSPPADDDEPPLRRLPPEVESLAGPVRPAGPPEWLTASQPGASAGPPKRFLLWVNNAGGYLVCTANRVTFGQGAGDGPVDVPLLADVSRLHAELTRDAEGYVLESQRAVAINGKPVTRAALQPGDRVTLGPSCQFVFHLPSPVSPSARLEFVSGHHFPLAVTSVLLMAEALILGPGPKAHVSLAGLGEPVVLFRGAGGLGMSFPGPFRVENEPCRDRAAVPVPAWVHGEAFGFGLEAVAARS